VAEVASAYLAVLADEIILKVTRETLDSQTKSYNLIKRSLDAGTTTALALRQAATTVDTAKANLAEYTRQAAQERNALMLLLGVPIPGDIQFSADFEAEKMSADLPVGVPSEVLQRRPDVLAAEHQLIAANADIGAARAAFFPSISLTGNVGTASTQLSGLFKPGSSAWSFSPQISVPIFTGGANMANLDLSKIEKNVYIAQYEKTLQTAIGCTASASGRRLRNLPPCGNPVSQRRRQLSSGAGRATLVVLGAAGRRQPAAAAAPEYGNSVQGARRRTERRFQCAVNLAIVWCVSANRQESLSD
jgi:multidrug efflux system outer membrane protein